MDTVEQPLVAKIVEVLADGLRRDVEALGEILDGDAADLARDR